MTPFVSVVICTHNPRADYLTRVLVALRGQTLPADRWELLVVDNASKDPVAPRFDVSWHPHARHIREDELGLTPARLRGIAESRADLIVFVDDDNVLDPDYLEQAYRIAQDYPFLAAWGCKLVAEYESPPAGWVHRYEPYLGVYDVPSPMWSNLPFTKNPCVPAGAGLCVRRSVASVYAAACRSQPGRRRLDRRGKELVSGGDYDLALTACEMGFGIGRFPQLRITHLIGASRTTLQYVSRLVEGIHYSSVMLGFHRDRMIPPSRTVTQRLADVVRAARLSRPHRQMFLAATRGTASAIRELSTRADS